MDSRTRFENWAKNKGWSVYAVPGANGEPCYVNMMVSFAWDAWQQALTEAALLCFDADKSTHPADLGDAIETLKGRAP